MKHSSVRRALLLAVASVPFTGACTLGSDSTRGFTEAQRRLGALESATGGRLGVAALNTADGTQVQHRADERFPFCSTFKVMAASAILKRSETENGLRRQHIAYTKDELVAYSPITAEHAGTGMTVSELCAAALQHSDNTAGNLLIKMLGGPAAVTAFARSIGDDPFRLDRWETELNTAIPGDPRDTTTPAAMAGSLQRLALGDALGAPERAMLIEWMRGNTTGAAKIRAGVPAAWSVADKTGGGDYGTTNDIAVMWPPGKPPIVLAVYFTQPDKDAPVRNDVVATAARIVAETLG
ncbi:class A beta-lactamase (plasmid) [Paraburkholderia sprentiae WSM5005]|uniref:beta-lactamase n=1 Tax=Paraburkholderia sprentiae WSM5005 TaxID=754502 RepID=A0A1I9YU65_9BURK|nr:class A beta-lactamase [Paraburkholderia sprentiae]APA89734.1 class A beta-lactamase [Paraburkholderia sprentiae WSM5005]